MKIKFGICKKCGEPTIRQMLDKNNGLCKDCKKKPKPKNIFDPKRDMNVWWLFNK